MTITLIYDASFKGSNQCEMLYQAIGYLHVIETFDNTLNIDFAALRVSEGIGPILWCHNFVAFLSGPRDNRDISHLY